MKCAKVKYAKKSLSLCLKGLAVRLSSLVVQEVCGYRRTLPSLPDVNDSCRLPRQLIIEPCDWLPKITRPVIGQHSVLNGVHLTGPFGLRKAKKRSCDAAKQAIKDQLFLDMHFS